MIESDSLKSLGGILVPIFVALLLIAELIGFLNLIIGGGLSDDMLTVCYVAVVTITMPVWGGLLVMGIAWVVDWSEQRARARRIARAKAAKLAAAA